MPNFNEFLPIIMCTSIHIKSMLFYLKTIRPFYHEFSKSFEVHILYCVKVKKNKPFSPFQTKDLFHIFHLFFLAFTYNFAYSIHLLDNEQCMKLMLLRMGL